MIKERIILTKEDALKESFMVKDIAGILEELNSDAKIVQLEYDYNENLKKELDDYFANYKPEDNTVFCIAAYLSKKEFSPEEYYLYEEEEGKKPLPKDEILERDSKVLIESGFVNVNDFVRYEYKVAFIYPNLIGLQVIEKINELVSEFEKNKEKENKTGFEIKTEVNNGYGPNAFTVIDKETGVNYIVIGMGGNLTMTPRLNADGSLYTTNNEK